MKWFSLELVLLAWLFMAWVSPSGAADQASKVQRGKYLVVEVARCGDCHTPMNDKGEPVTEKWLQGTALMFKPTVDMPWADTAANIARTAGLEHPGCRQFLHDWQISGPRTEAAHA